MISRKQNSRYDVVRNANKGRFGLFCGAPYPPSTTICSTQLGPRCDIRPKDAEALENGLTLDIEPDHAASDQGAQYEEYDRPGETLLWKEQN